jgi:hypothetical protein
MRTAPVGRIRDTRDFGSAGCDKLTAEAVGGFGRSSHPSLEPIRSDGMARGRARCGRFGSTTDAGRATSRAERKRMGRAHPTPTGWAWSQGAAAGHARGPSGHGAGARRERRPDDVHRDAQGLERRDGGARRATTRRRGAARGFHRTHDGASDRHGGGDGRTAFRSTANTSCSGHRVDQERTRGGRAPCRPGNRQASAHGLVSTRRWHHGEEGSERLTTVAAPGQGSPGEHRARRVGNGSQVQRTPDRKEASKVPPAKRRSGNAKGAGTHGDVGARWSGGERSGGPGIGDGHAVATSRGSNPMNPRVGSGMQQAREAIGGASCRSGEKPRTAHARRVAPSRRSGPRSVGCGHRTLSTEGRTRRTLWKVLGHEPGGSERRLRCGARSNAAGGHDFGRRSRGPESSLDPAQ